MKSYVIALSTILTVPTVSAMPIVSGFDQYNGEPNPQNIGFEVNFLGGIFDEFYINRRGNVTFNTSMSSFAGDLNQHGQHIIAPFFEGITTPLTNQNITFGSGFFEGYDSYGVNWTDVSGLATSGTNTFQLLLVNRWDPADDTTYQGDFDAIFNYGKIEWDKSLLGETSRIGFSAPGGTVDNNTFFQLHGSPGTFVDETGSYSLVDNSINSNVVGRYVFNFRDGEYVPPVQVPEPGIMLLLGISLLLMGVMHPSITRSLVIPRQ